MFLKYDSSQIFKLTKRSVLFKPDTNFLVNVFFVTCNFVIALGEKLVFCNF